MTSLNELHFNIDEFEGSKMVYIIPDNFGTFESEIAIYYNKKKSKTKNKDEKIKKKEDLEDASNKLFLKTPKMYCPFDPSESKYTYEGNTYTAPYRNLALSFRHIGHLYNEDKVDKLKKFVAMVDDVNREIIITNSSILVKKKKKSETISFKNCIVKSDNYPDHCIVNVLPGRNDTPIIGVFDENGKASDFSIIKKNSIVSCILEIRSIKLNTKKCEFRTVYVVHQIRKWKELSSVQLMYKELCLLIDDEDPDDNAFEDLKKKLDQKYNEKLRMPNYTQLIGGQLNYTYQPLPLGIPGPPPPPSVGAPIPPPPPPKKNEILRPAFMVSPDELNSALKKLKQTKKD